MGTDIIFRQLFDKESFTFSYLIGDAVSKQAIFIDTVVENTQRDLGLLRELGLELKFILETHVHADHITGAGELRAATGALTAMGRASAVRCADLLLDDQRVIPFSAFEIRALATPGHTNACFSYFIPSLNAVFTGDSLCIRTAGRTDFQNGSAQVLYRSITEKLYALPDTTLVYPSHDYCGFTVSTIGEEKKFNARIPAHCSQAQFVATMEQLNLAPPKKMHVAVPANLVCGSV